MFINNTHLFISMRFAINLEDTKESLDFFDELFNKISFCPNYTLDIFIIQEMKEQEKEIKKLKEKIQKQLKKQNIKGEIIIDTGEPIARIIKLIDKKNIEVFICQYEHSILGTTFFENLKKEIDIPILTL